MNATRQTKLLAASFATLASFALADDYALNWYTIDCGGGTSAAGDWSLSGTIGQSDAGGTLTGGDYSLQGGFWVGGAMNNNPCAPCAADYNQDGGIDGADVSAFFADWEAGAGCSDVNQDGGIDGADVGAFFAVWEAGGC